MTTTPSKQRNLFLGSVSTAAVVLLVAGLAFPHAASSLPVLPPSASLSVSPNPALINQTVTFDGSGSTGDGLGGSITTYEWDLDGDGVFETNTGNSPSASRAYAEPGSITVRLQVTDSEGDSDEDSEVLVVNTPPSASFIYEPSTPGVNEQITFSSTSSDPDGQLSPGSLRWDFDDDRQFDDAAGETVSHSFGSAGTKIVRLQVTDADGATAVSTRGVLVQTSPPSATFRFSPETPLSNETVTFDGSASSPPPGETITGLAWDLDGDGEFDEAAGPTANFSYPSPGPRTVRLRVDSTGSFDITSRVVVVGNRAPLASFKAIPRSPRAGDTVELASTSSDPDGPVEAHSWDLNDDGQYDDADGPTARATYGKVGKYVVGLRVRDANGTTTEVRKRIEVRPRRLDQLSPFPVARLSGELKPDGSTVITRFSVRAPKKTKVTVRCQGGSCPFGRKTRTVKKGGVKFPELERKLEPEVVVRVYAAKRGAIGGFTRFNLRRGKPPQRHERCLRGLQRKPIPCNP